MKNAEKQILSSQTRAGDTALPDVWTSDKPCSTFWSLYGDWWPLPIFLSTLLLSSFLPVSIFCLLISESTISTLFFMPFLVGTFLSELLFAISLSSVLAVMKAWDRARSESDSGWTRFKDLMQQNAFVSSVSSLTRGFSLCEVCERETMMMLAITAIKLSMICRLAYSTETYRYHLYQWW